MKYLYLIFIALTLASCGREERDCEVNHGTLIDTTWTVFSVDTVSVGDTAFRDIDCRCNEEENIQSSGHEDANPAPAMNFIDGSSAWGHFMYFGFNDSLGQSFVCDTPGTFVYGGDLTLWYCDGSNTSTFVVPDTLVVE